VLVDFNRILGVIILALNDGKKVNFNNYEWGFLLDLQSQAQCEFVNHVLQLFFSKLRLLLRFNGTANPLPPHPTMVFSTIIFLNPNSSTKSKLQVTSDNHLLELFWVSFFSWFGIVQIKIQVVFFSLFKSILNLILNFYVVLLVSTFGIAMSYVSF
jgi:hypothetical protein